MNASESVSTPRDVRDLERPEHFLVWSLRAIVVGCGDCPTMRRTFQCACGDDGAVVMADLMVLVKLVGLTARRRLTLHVPGCICLSADEMAVLEVVAAAQEALISGDETCLHAHAVWLVESDAIEGVKAAATAVAAGMARAQLRLPLRTGEVVEMENARPRVVH